MEIGNTSDGGLIIGGEGGNLIINPIDGGFGWPPIYVGISPDALWNEGIGAGLIKFTLSEPAYDALSISFNTVDGSATAGVDYVPIVNGVVTFQSGEFEKYVAVTILNDNIFEGDEVFYVVMNNGIKTITTAITINDAGNGDHGLGLLDDDRPRVLSVSNPFALEGSNLNFDIAISNPSTTETDVSITVQSETATLGIDTGVVLYSVNGGATYQALTSTKVTLPPMTSAVKVRVPALTDDQSEPTETIRLLASTSQNQSAVSGIGTVLNVDPIGKSFMADLNDLNKPDPTSSYVTEVFETLRAHITRLWRGDYAGMGNLVAGMRRWIPLTGSNVKLMSRNADGTESIVFDSTNKADVEFVNSGLAAKANSSDLTNALNSINTKANTSQVFGVGQSWSTPNRQAGVTYLNSSGRPIIVHISSYLNTGQAALMFPDFFIDSNKVSTDIVTLLTAGGFFSFYFIVPSGSTYSSNKPIGAKWIEYS